ncbi:hypothetical protein D3C76_1470510 [compost metagenome]
MSDLPDSDRHDLVRQRIETDGAHQADDIAGRRFADPEFPGTLVSVELRQRRASSKVTPR